jgi:hypothetical protein
LVGAALVAITYSELGDELTVNLASAIQCFVTLVGEVLLFSSPFYNLAFANLRVDDIKLLFSNTSPGDFASMGGVGEWTGFMNASPLYWTCFGVPVTFTVMQSYFTTIVGFIPVITVLLKSLSF